MTRAFFEEISLKATGRFKRETLKIESLVCTTAIGNNCKVYKVFNIFPEKDTVQIALPDLVMEEVPIATLYDPNDAEDMFWETVEGKE